MISCCNFCVRVVGNPVRPHEGAPVSPVPPATCSPVCRPESSENHHFFAWELLCAGFRHSASFHARVILDGATCRLKELGDVRDVLGVLGVDRVVPILLRVLV